MTGYDIDRTLFPEYRHNGTRALVELHENYLRRFFDTWTDAKDADLSLPDTDDPDYASHETLLMHVLSAATAYLQWICRSLELPDPETRPVPDSALSGEEAQTYLDHVLERWRSPLVGVEEEQLYRPGYPTRRGVDACVEAMLQHAIMHPIRHDYQLRKLLENGGATRVQQGKTIRIAHVNSPVTPKVHRQAPTR